MACCQYTHGNSADTRLHSRRQYSSFTKQRDELHARQAELDTSSESIQELIEVLDARKDEAIERTFKQVGKYFAEVFEKLVPTGRGRLIMQRREHREREDRMDVDDDDDDEASGAEAASVENYTGVAIRVSFNSKTNEGLKIQQLSGGQKALVALAISKSRGRNEQVRMCADVLGCACSLCDPEVRPRAVLPV